MIKCEICNKECSSDSKLKIHLETHLGDKYHKEIQQLYLEKEYSLRDLTKAGYLKGDISRALKGKIRTLSDSLKIANKKYPTKSKEAKKRMSKSKKEYFEKHPDKLPYKLQHSSNKSIVEEILKEALKKHFITGWVHRYEVSIYEYDIAFPIQKIDIEIDGRTHKMETVREKDRKRDEWSKKQGWTVLRFTAGAVRQDVERCITIIKQYLTSISESTYNSTVFIRKQSDRKKVEKQLQLKRQKEDKIVEQQILIERLLQSDINFSKLGWVSKTAKLIEKRPQKVGLWMKKYMTEFYESKCFKRSRCS